MKRIAFFVQHMHCGGVENSLAALVNDLVKEDCHITVYAINKEGEFLSKISDAVTVKEIPLSKKTRRYLPVGGTKISVRTKLREGHFFQAGIVAFKHLLHPFEFSELDTDFSKISCLSEEYDVAVNYHIHSPFLVRFLSEKVIAKQKYSWIHNDFTTTRYEINRLKGYLDCNDRFFGVSQKLCDEFIAVFPEYKQKTEVAQNIIHRSEILEAAEKFYPAEFSNQSSGLKLLTCGRLEEQKGYDLAIEACKKLKEEQYDFKWYVLGKGSEYKKLKTLISKNRLEKTFILLGTRMNPYPYFKNCDIYVQTSRHEGCAIAVNEAKMLGKPIVCTDVAGAQEQLKDGINGEISEISVEGICRKVRKLFNNKALLYTYSLKLQEEPDCDSYQFLQYFK